MQPSSYHKRITFFLNYKMQSSGPDWRGGILPLRAAPFRFLTYHILDMLLLLLLNEHLEDGV